MIDEIRDGEKIILFSRMQLKRAHRSARSLKLRLNHASKNGQRVESVLFCVAREISEGVELSGGGFERPDPNIHDGASRRPCYNIIPVITTSVLSVYHEDSSSFSSSFYYFENIIITGII